MFELVYLVIPGVSQLLVSPLLSVLPCLKFNDLLAAGHLSSSPSRWQPLAKVADNLLVSGLFLSICKFPESATEMLLIKLVVRSLEFDHRFSN